MATLTVLLRVNPTFGFLSLWEGWYETCIHCISRLSEFRSSFVHMRLMRLTAVTLVWRVREYCLLSYIDTGYYFCTLKHLFAFAVNRIRTKLLESEIFDWMQWMHVSYHPSHKERNPNVGFTLNNTVNVANYINYIHFRTIRVVIISSLSLIN